MSTPRTLPSVCDGLDTDAEAPADDGADTGQTTDAGADTGGTEGVLDPADVTDDGTGPASGPRSTARSDPPDSAPGTRASDEATEWEPASSASDARVAGLTAGSPPRAETMPPARIVDVSRETSTSRASITGHPTAAETGVDVPSGHPIPTEVRAEAVTEDCTVDDLELSAGVSTTISCSPS